MPAKNLTDVDQLKTFGNDLVILDFWADWCKPCVQLNQIFDQLADKYPNIHFLKVEAEKLESVTEKFEINSVPSFIFLKDQNTFDKVEGANAPELANKIEKYNSEIKPSLEKKTDDLESKKLLRDRLEKLINFAPVMLFMKGTATAPQCGFSRKIVEILNNEEIKFESFNILEDEEVRQGLKEFSNWPTYPQLYMKGNFIGGLDIVKELSEQGELKTQVPKQKDLNERLSELVNSAPVMLFMKGTPTAPQCGFSRKIVDILNQNSVQYKSFDILNDEEVRQGLKALSNWPTYPQLYSKGKLMGGLDIVKELAEEDQLLDSLK